MNKREYNQRYYAKHREKVLQQKREYYEREKNRISAYQKEYRENNRDKISAANKKWRSENPDHNREYLREWKLMNPDKDREYCERWRAVPGNTQAKSARRRAVFGSLSKREVREIMSMSCAYCGDSAQHLDHCTPISRGGWNDAENCVAACAPCNLSKGSKTVLEFAGLWPKKTH